MKCKNCGTEFMEGIFCPECGTKYEQVGTIEIDSKQEIKGPKDNSDKKKGKILAFVKIIGGVLVGLMVIGMFAPTTGDEEDNNDYLNENIESEDVVLDEDATSDIDTTNIEIDYGAVYGGIIDSVISSVSMNGGDVDYLTCSLYDMNNDGYKELIIENGTCAADVVFEVYTISEQCAKYLGGIGGYCGFYKDENGNGIYTDYCSGGYERVDYVYIENGELCFETLIEQETDEYGYVEGVAIEQLKYSLDMMYISELYMGENQEGDVGEIEWFAGVYSKPVGDVLYSVTLTQGTEYSFSEYYIGEVAAGFTIIMDGIEYNQELVKEGNNCFTIVRPGEDAVVGKLYLTESSLTIMESYAMDGTYELQYLYEKP